jgi:SAM-dependent methyltransferase
LGKGFRKIQANQKKIPYLPLKHSMMTNHNDVFGKGLWQYHQSPSDQELITWTSLTEEDPVPLSYFFRTFDQMPPLEKKALEMAQGKVLDIGCGTGCHSLYLQNQRNLSVVGLDSSPAAIRVATERGLLQTVNQSIFDFKGDTFDTLLLLMNGPGICGSLDRLQLFLEKLQKLLNPGGQILLDSSDLIYLFDETPEGEKIIPANQYYGELQYGIRFENNTETFPWLYVDYGHLSHSAHQVGLETQLILEGQNWDYLARLTKEY